MFKMFAVLVLLACLRFGTSADVDDYCYATDTTRYLYMGTRTPYHFVHGGKIGYESVPNCKPLQVWMTARHGTRYPSESEIMGMIGLRALRDEVLDNHAKGRGTLCEGDLENLRNWQPDPSLTLRQAKYLTTQGIEDLYLLAKRLQSNYPELLQPNTTAISSDDYKFRSTDTQRTIASMNSFMAGLFGKAGVVDTEVIPVANDTLLKMYKSCKAWSKELKEPYVSKETNEFVNGPHFKELVATVSRRLGFSDAIDTKTASAMYETCRFEKAWSVNKTSPWCAVFTKKELSVFEYEEDLYHYYHTSYGAKYASAIGCPLLQDLFAHFLKVENGNPAEEPNGVFYFAHDATIQLLYTAMGIANDSVPLRASNYETMGDRKWRTSFISSFAANLVAVFYKCGDSYKVQFRLAEKPLPFEGCDSGLCDWDYLKQNLLPVASRCSLEFCQKNVD